MRKLFQSVHKGLDILTYRLRTQGVRTTALWMYARGVPKITGIPIAKYSQITQQIYIGAQFQHMGKRRLKRWGVTGVVNMRIEYDDADYGLVLDYYCHLPTIDDDAPTLEHLYEGVAFMRQIISRGGRVYIHCAGGIGRAPTMAVAYFICHGFSADDAIRLIKQTRPFINITPVQMTMLRRLDRLERERANGTGAEKTEV